MKKFVTRHLSTPGFHNLTYWPSQAFKGSNKRCLLPAPTIYDRALPFRLSALLPFCIFTLLSLCISAQNVAINTSGTPAHPSAILDVSSTEKGVLVPRVTSSERASIQDPAVGLLVFDTSTNSFWYFSDSWKEISDESFSLPYTATAASPQHLLSITNTFNGLISNTAILGRRKEGSSISTGFSTAIWGDASLGTGILGTSNTHAGVYGKSLQDHGVYGHTEAGVGLAGVYGRQGTSGIVPASSMGIWGDNEDGLGVVGTSASGVGTYGFSTGYHGVYGYTTMTNFAGVFGSTSANNGIGVKGMVSGTGAGVEGEASASWAIGVRGISTAPIYGIGIYGRTTSGDTTGIAVKAEGYSTSTFTGAMHSINWGTGSAVSGYCINGTGVAGQCHNPYKPAVHGKNGSGGIGVMGESGGVFEAEASIGVFGQSSTFGYGYGVVGKAWSGDGIRGYAGLNGGYGVSGSDSENGNGGAGYFKIANSANPNHVVRIDNEGLGTSFLVRNYATENTSPLTIYDNYALYDFAAYRYASTNRIRFDINGKGFFDGGTQTGGADIAEAFDTEDDISAYEPGDVLVISISRDRTVTKSAEPYSDLVAGVYATRPGVLMTEEHIDTDLSGQAPMGVIGVIPTKVCIEGGEIRRGDLLVTSSTPGVAMKGDRNRIRAGQVLGKALENHDSHETGLIRVLVNVQ